MNKFKKLALRGLVSTIVILGLVGCESEASTVSNNLSKSADSFEVQRRVVFFNGITDTYLLSVEGLCSINTDSERKVTVTCKVSEGQYKKHYLGLSDNVSYFVEQTDAKFEDKFHYKVLFRPESIIPNIELQTSN